MSLMSSFLFGILFISAITLFIINCKKIIRNIGTFPNEKDGKGMDILKQLYTSSDSDLIMLCEHNLKTISNILDSPQEIMGSWIENSKWKEKKKKNGTKEADMKMKEQA